MDFLYIVGIPIVVLVLMAGCRKMIRGTRFQWRDWFLGVDASLTALTTGMASLADLFRIDPHVVGFCLVVSLFALFLTMILHQDCENMPKQPDGRPQRKVIFWLGICGNVAGFGALVMILILIKRAH